MRLDEISITVEREYSRIELWDHEEVGDKRGEGGKGDEEGLTRKEGRKQRHLAVLEVTSREHVKEEGMSHPINCFN